MAGYLIRQGIVLGLPVLISLTTLLISLPRLCRCVTNTSFLLTSQADKEDLGLLRKTPPYFVIEIVLSSFLSF